MTDSEGRETVVGVTSFGSVFGCAHSFYPSVYARVSAVLPWIDEIAGKICRP